MKSKTQTGYGKKAKELFKKNSGFLLIIILLCNSLFTSCDKSKSEAVEFYVSPADLTFILDSISDSTNVTDTFYIGYASLNLDFFRTACETENVYLDDVSSVTISKAELSTSAASLNNFNAFRKINLDATSSVYSPIQLASVNTIMGTDSVKILLTPISTNLYDYFRLHDFNCKFVLGKKITDVIHPIHLTFKPQFKVKGTNH